MLDPAIKSQLTSYLGRLQRDIELVVSYDERPASQELRELVADILACSPRVHVREDATQPLAPSFGITVPGEPVRVRFAGLPLGHEFTSLVLALLQVGGAPSQG